MTDADLVLGRLDPASFWNGRLHLDVDAAHAALGTIGRDITMSAEETAVAAIDIIDAHMADAGASRPLPGRRRRPWTSIWWPSGAWGGPRRSPVRHARHAAGPDTHVGSGLLRSGASHR